MPRWRLSDIELDFVSLVPAGDDPEARVVIAKTEPVLKRRARKSADPAAPSPTLSPDTASRNEGAMMSAEISKADLDPEVRDYVEGLEAEVDALGAQVQKSEEMIQDLEGQISKMVPRDQESADEIEKSLLAKADPALRSLIEKSQAQARQAEEIAKAEREQRLSREFLSKAETLSMLSDKETLAGLLRRAAEALTPEDNESLEKILKSADGALRQSDLLKEFGRGGAETTISKSVEAAAREIQKNDPALTFEQAQEKAFMENPDLLTQAMTSQED